jgi:hypothetical protein
MRAIIESVQQDSNFQYNEPEAKEVTDFLSLVEDFTNDLDVEDGEITFRYFILHEDVEYLESDSHLKGRLDMMRKILRIHHLALVHINANPNSELLINMIIQSGVTAKEQLYDFLQEIVAKRFLDGIGSDQDDAALMCGEIFMESNSLDLDGFLSFVDANPNLLEEAIAELTQPQTAIMNQGAEQLDEEEVFFSKSVG